MEWTLLLIGFATGVYGVVVGAGGGFILVPILILFWGVDPGIASGTSLALVAVNSWSGTFGYRKMKLIDLRSGTLFAMAAIPGSILAPIVIGSVDTGVFNLLFACLLLALCLQLAFRIMPSPDEGEQGTLYINKTHRWLRFTLTSRIIDSSNSVHYIYSFNESLAIGFNFILGFISSFFGTGGGFIRTPVLVSLFNFPTRVAVATSIFSLSIYSFFGALIHGLMGHIDFSILIWTGIGLALGGQLGVKLAVKLSGMWILRLLLVVLLILSVQLILQTWMPDAFS